MLVLLCAFMHLKFLHCASPLIGKMSFVGKMNGSKMTGFSEQDM